MNRTATSGLWKMWILIAAVLAIFVAMGTTPALAVDTTGNNLTMIDSAGNPTTGGTNDVRFTWDETMKTSVAVSGQASNATITSTCPYFANTWSAHDVAVYGPGTYTVYTGCAAGSPGCGTGATITFTVGEGELGVHMLFDWNVNKDIDVVNVWKPNAVFGPKVIWPDACGANDVSKVWDWMSSDGNGDNINGFSMVDGPFQGMNANFNVMGLPGGANNAPGAPVLTMPGQGAVGLGTTVEFRWKKVADPDNDPITYLISYSTDSTFAGYDPIPAAPQQGATASKKGIFFAGGAGLLLIGMTFIGGISNRKRIVLLLIVAVMIAGGSIIACSSSNSDTDEVNLPIDEMSHTASGLTPASTYYWKITADDGKAGGTSTSEVRNFTTQ